MPRSFLVKKAPTSRTGDGLSQNTPTSCLTATGKQRTIDSPNDGADDDVSVTSPINAGENSAVASVGSHPVEPSVASNHVTTRWMLVSKRPDVCYWLDSNLPVGDDVKGKNDDTTSQCAQRQQRLPLTILFGSPVKSTVTAASSRPAAGDAPKPPWRPFSVHEDNSTVTAPLRSTAAGSQGDVHTTTAVQSSIDEVARAVQQRHVVLGPAAGLRQCTPTDFRTAVQHPFQLHPGTRYNVLAIDQICHQKLLMPVCQEVVESRFACPAVTSSSISTTRQLLCAQCGRLFTTLNDLIRHRQSSYNCQSSSCSSSSSPQSGSTGSPPTRSPSPLLSCPHCDKTYTSSGALKMHVRTHTLPCRCPACGKAFSRPWLLQGHLRTHTGERPFTCSVCGRAFADRSNLRAHLQTHAAAKRYQCTGCRRSFSRLSLLVRHERHTTSDCCRGRHDNGFGDTGSISTDLQK